MADEFVKVKHNFYIPKEKLSGDYLIPLFDGTLLVVKNPAFCKIKRPGFKSRLDGP